MMVTAPSLAVILQMKRMNFEHLLENSKQKELEATFINSDNNLKTTQHYLW